MDAIKRSHTKNINSTMSSGYKSLHKQFIL